ARADPNPVRPAAGRGARASGGRPVRRDHHGRERPLGEAARPSGRGRPPRGDARAAAHRRGGDRPRRPLADGVRVLDRELVAPGIDPRGIDENTVAAHLYAPELPDPDLLIRTSGELRISNFLLWQLAYAELVFVDTLWPDFGERQLREALVAYARRRRRFGG